MLGRSARSRAWGVMQRRGGRLAPSLSVLPLQRCATARGCAGRRGRPTARGDWMTLIMRGISALLAALGVVSAAGGAVAQSYPARAITLVVPFAPGGSAST